MSLCFKAYRPYRRARKSKDSSFPCSMPRPQGSRSEPRVERLGNRQAANGVVLTSRAGNRWTGDVRGGRGLLCACLLTHRLPFIDRILRALDRSGWMVFELIENYSHRLFELWVA